MACVPRVDLAASNAADQLASGLRELGFVQLDNHGASTAAARELRAACDTFFALDVESKMQTVHPDSLANRGWRSRGSESLRYSLGETSPPDLFESFNCGHDDRVIVDDPHELIAKTIWPDACPELKPAARRWLEEMHALSRQLDELISQRLSIDLVECSQAGPDTMACIDYRPNPDGSEPTADGQQRMGAHSDYTTFTVLHADAVAGLQILDSSNDWIDVIPDAGSLLLNVGDVLAMYTNDVWPSTVHRVIPMSAGAAATRRSVAYFHYPNLDVVVSPLAEFVAVERPARYEPITVEAHLRAKLAAPKQQRPATSGSTLGDRSV